MYETAHELVGSAFYFAEDTFDAVPIPVCFVLESETALAVGCLQPRRVVNEKDSIIDEMYLAEFVEEHLGENPAVRVVVPSEVERC